MKEARSVTISSNMTIKRPSDTSETDRKPKLMDRLQTYCHWIKMNCKKISILSLVALIISIISLFVSVQTAKTSYNQYKLLLEPELRIEYSIDNGKNQYIFTVINDGADEIHEIHIKNRYKIFDYDTKETRMSVGSSISMEPECAWKYIKVLKPGNRENISISDVIGNLFLADEKKENQCAIVVFDIIFKRELDRKVFRKKKHFEVSRDMFSKKPIVSDPDMHEYLDNL